MNPTSKEGRKTIRVVIAEDQGMVLGALAALLELSLIHISYMFLPKFVRQIALALPPFHLSQLALGTVGAGFQQSTATHWEVLLAFTLICLGIARIGFQRDKGKLYG